MTHLSYEKRLVAVGDIHGCAKELETLLSLVPEEGTTWLFLGDLVDRGPDSKRVIEIVYDLHKRGIGYCVMGNHDDSHVRWSKHLKKKAAKPSYQIPMHFSDHKKAVNGTLPEDFIQYLASLPPYLEFSHEGKQWVGVHAGLEPSKTLDQQDKGKCTHLRYLNNETMKPASLGDDFEPPAGSVYWTLVYDQSESVVYGHMVHSKEVPLVTKTSKATLLGLDTGCCFGGNLTAAVFEVGVTEPKFITVPAEKDYCPYTVWKPSKLRV